MTEAVRRSGSPRPRRKRSQRRPAATARPQERSGIPSSTACSSPYAYGPGTRRLRRAPYPGTPPRGTHHLPSHEIAQVFLAGRAPPPPHRPAPTMSDRSVHREGSARSTPSRDRDQLAVRRDDVGRDALARTSLRVHNDHAFADHRVASWVLRPNVRLSSTWANRGTKGLDQKRGDCRRSICVAPAVLGLDVAVAPSFYSIGNPAPSQRRRMQLTLIEPQEGFFLLVPKVEHVVAVSGGVRPCRG